MDTHHTGIRVLHLIASTDRRGAETAAVSLAARLSGHGFPGEVIALVPGAQGGLDLPSLGPSRFAPSAMRTLRRRAADVDVLIAHGSSTLPAAALATSGSPTPFVYRSIGDPAAWLTTPARRIRAGWAARRAAGLVALWRGAAVTWHRDLHVRPERLTVIPNGVDTRRFEPASPEARAAGRAAMGLPPDAPIVMCLGALSPEKRVDLAMDAVASLGPVTLAVVGDGPQRDRLPVPPGAEDRVRFLGSTSEPWRALAVADALVIPSDTEGQPAVAIEAGLMGLPVVATRVGGLPEIVLDGSTGVLVPPGDARALSAALHQSLAERDRFGRAAREHCLRNFSLDQVAEKWVQFLQSLIKSGAIQQQRTG